MITNNMKKTLLGVKVSAIIEILIYLSAVCICSHIWGNGDRFINITPHPFWLILILIVIQYDLPETIVCILLMIIFLYAGNIPPQKFLVNTFDYYFSLSLRPILWLGVGILIDGIRKRRTKQASEFEKIIDDLNIKLETISKSYNTLQTKNENLEAKLASELNSSIKIYNAAKKLEQLDKINYMQIMEDVILAVLPANKFSIYLYDNDKGLSLSYASRWAKEDKYAKNFSSSSTLYNAIVIEKRTLFIARKRDEKILTNQGVLAGPLYDKNSGEILGMLKYENIDFNEIVSKKIELFKLLCQWLGSAYYNILTVENAKENSMVNRDNMLYSNNFLQYQVEFLTKLAKRTKFSLSSLSIKIANINSLNNFLKKKAVLFLGETVRKNLRTTDQVFDQNYRSGEYLLLLPSADKAGAYIVLEKLKKVLLDKKNGELSKIEYSFQIEVLNNND
jgi:polysaccharide biosynthesis protein PelD